MNESNFYCTVEWHLAKLTNFAAVIYPFAYRVSKKSRLFHCSTENIADHFGVSRWTVSRAIGQLEQSGFFELVMREAFRPSTYRVLSHKEWGGGNPDCCAVKISFPWSGEKGDALGQSLYNASGGRIMLQPHKLAALRKTWLPDETIVHAFGLFMAVENRRRERGGWHGRWREAQYRFLRWIKGEMPDEERERLELPHLDFKSARKPLAATKSGTE